MAEERAAFLMTECNQETFAFTAHFSRRVEAGFMAGQVSTDGGALLLREVDRKINLIDRRTIAARSGARYAAASAAHPDPHAEPCQ